MYVGNGNEQISVETLNPEVSVRHELTSSQDTDCEQLLIYLLSQPDLKVTHTDFGYYVRETLMMDKEGWLAVVGELLDRKIVKITSSDPDMKRKDTIEINTPGLVEVFSGKYRPPYLTPELSRAAIDARDRQRQAIDARIGSVVLTDDALKPHVLAG